MKQLITLAILTSLLVTGCSSNNQTKSSGTVDIKDMRKTHEPVPVNYYHENLAKHKYHDVEVYRAMDGFNTDSVNIDSDASYIVLFYRNSNDTLKCYEASYGAEEDMNKAAYKWENDTLVSIRLYNSGTKKEIAFKLFGKDNKTGMITDD